MRTPTSILLNALFHPEKLLLRANKSYIYALNPYAVTFPLVRPHDSLTETPYSANAKLKGRRFLAVIFERLVMFLLPCAIYRRACFLIVVAVILLETLQLDQQKNYSLTLELAVMMTL